MGGEVVLKAVAPGLLHKSDVGAVRLHLNEPEAVRQAAVEMADRVKAATGQYPTGFLVQHMVPTGVEMLVGVVNDPQFGPTIACGAGGTMVELLKDVSVRLDSANAVGCNGHDPGAAEFPLRSTATVGLPGATSPRWRTSCCA